MRIRLRLAAAAAASPCFAWGFLTISAPAQYRLILEDAAARGWPIFFAGIILVVGSLCCLGMLQSRSTVSAPLAMLVSAPPIMAMVSILAGAGFSVIVLVGLIAALALPLAFCAFKKLIKTQLGENFWNLFPAGGLGMMLLLFAGFAGASAISPVAMPRAVGALAILSVFLASLGVLGCFAVLRPRVGTMIAGWWVVAAFAFAPNNHEVPTRPANSLTQPVEQALRNWIGRRGDLDAYRRAGLPYPVIFVSSEGGGIYAASHAYSVLSALAKRCPTFAQHVFVTVGVSGGAVGNALFHGSVNPRQRAASPCTPGDAIFYESAVAADHLSPVLARFLLLETLDSLVPGQWVGRDRGGVLADSFRASGGSSSLDTLVGDTFDPTSARPAVAAVATDVVSGRRVVLSPISASSDASRWWPDQSRSRSNDTSVLEAAIISARFPWVTPTARLRLSAEEVVVLADGGYSDNSGSETVLELIQELRTAEANQMLDEQMGNIPSERVCRLRVARNFHQQVSWNGCEIHVFPIHLAITTTNINPEADPGPAEPSQSFLLDPLSTLIASRSPRGVQALRRSAAEQCGSFGGVCVEQPDASIGFFASYISPSELNLPLGWFIHRHQARTLGRTAVPKEIFDYRERREPVSNDLGLLILHLDPELWTQESGPAIYDYLGDP